MIFNYKRVSTTEQNTERQLIGVDCDREFIETASGKDTNRIQLQALLGVIREGDLINIHELSRLARNTQDLLNIVNEIVEKGASIKFLKENLSFDGVKKDDAFQKLMLTMLGAISTFERDLLLERQREGIALAKKKGKYKGRPSRFSSEKIEEIKKLFGERNNKAELAKELNISRGYLYQVVK
jgi:DNA invertase Pin-like site-specific DNA recombinase